MHPGIPHGMGIQHTQGDTVMPHGMVCGVEWMDTYGGDMVAI